MAKDKKGPLERAFSAGGVVFRKKNSTTEWLLIKPAGTQRWQLPKGTVDENERSSDTARREVFEETGIKARVLEKIDSIQYFFNLGGKRIFKTVAFFLMQYQKGVAAVDKRWEHEIDEVRWFETREALERMSFDNERRILEKAAEKVKQGIQESLV